MGRLIAAVSSAIAIGFGLLTLIGLLSGGVGIFAALAELFLRLVVIITAIAVIIGIVNLLLVHLRRIRARSGGWGYSIVLVISTFAVLLLVVLERANLLSQQTPSITNTLFETVQVSIESALAGLVLFALVYGAYRLLHRRVTWSGIIFTLVLIVLLVGALPLPGLGLIASIRDWLLVVPVGLALATVVAGVRVLIGQDRSYRE
jgi:drug/metabolite transporter (DMT)-like permease